MNAPHPGEPPQPVLSVARPPPDWLGPGVLVPVFTLMVTSGYFLLLRGLATPAGHEPGKATALFTAVNAATLTGFQQEKVANPADLTDAGRWLLLGLMLAGILFSFIGGGLAVVRIARLRYTDRQITMWAVLATAVAALLGGVGLIGDGRAGFDPIFQALSAFGNCGLVSGRLPDGAGAQTFLVLLPLATLGGLGIPVLMELFDWLRRRASPSPHARTALVWSAGVYLTVTLGLFLLQWPTTPHAVAQAASNSSRMAINARSAGLPFPASVPQVVTGALIVVMLIGACPGGSAGGLKVTTLAVCADGVRRAVRGQPVGRPFGLALVWVALYLGTVGCVTLALLISEPDLHLDRLLFLAASAVGNVGLAHEPIGLSPAGLYVLSVAMMLGRVGPVLMLWYVAETTPEARVAMA